MASGSGTAASQGQAQAAAAGPSRSTGGARHAPQATTAQMAAAAAAAAAHQAHAQLGAPSHGVHLHQVPDIPPFVQPTHPPAHRRPHVAQAPIEGHDAANPARVFKLQYDVRRIICCSQTSVIVGWDFCNDDPELQEASRFFGHVQ
jgi:F-box and WD-40 domain protein 1/11